MVLASQATRSGLNRRYMSSRRKGGSKWPWIGGALGVAVIFTGWQMFGGSGEGAAAEVLSPSTAAAATTADLGAGDEQPRPKLGAAAPPLESYARTTTTTPAPAPALPTPSVPTITLSETTRPAPSPTNPALAQVLPAPADSRPATPAAAPVPTSPARSSNAGTGKFAQGMEFVEQGRLVEGRQVLSDLLMNRPQDLSPADAQAVRDTLMSVNRELVFSNKVFPGDPLVEQYAIQSGDYIARLAPKWKVPQQFVVNINNVNPSKLLVGQKIKFVKGPFHARVVKSDYRMDIFLKDSGGQPVYVCSFPVGLGEGDSTPLGRWIIEPGRKVKNPGWANPRTGQQYAPDDPTNPIGEYWLALKGTDPATEPIGGYGIHGTIAPESIGNMMSMGCVRLRDADIEQVFNMLQDGESTVEIVR